MAGLQIFLQTRLGVFDVLEARFSETPPEHPQNDAARSLDAAIFVYRTDHGFERVGEQSRVVVTTTLPGAQTQREGRAKIQLCRHFRQG